MSSFKIFLTQTFPRCAAKCYILPSRAMAQLFNGVNFVYRSFEVYLTFCSKLASFSQNPKLLQWRTVLTTPVGDLPRYVLDRLFDNLTDKSY